MGYTVNIILQSLGQEFRGGLVGCSWLRVFHEAALRMSAGAAVTGHLQSDWGWSVCAQLAHVQGRWQEVQLHGVLQPAHPCFCKLVVNI